MRPVPVGPDRPAAGDKALFQNAVQSIAERSRQNAEDLCRYTQDLCLGYLHTLLGNDQAVAPWLAEGRSPTGVWW